jgi:hypothetical protein
MGYQEFMKACSMRNAVWARHYPDRREFAWVHGEPTTLFMNGNPGGAVWNVPTLAVLEDYGIDVYHSVLRTVVRNAALDAKHDIAEVYNAHHPTLCEVDEFKDDFPVSEMTMHLYIDAYSRLPKDMNAYHDTIQDVFIRAYYEMKYTLVRGLAWE